MSKKVLSCPWCGDKGRSLNDGPWDETGYTHCMNSDCPSVDKNGEPQRLPIALWNALPRKVDLKRVAGQMRDDLFRLERYGIRYVPEEKGLTHYNSYISVLCRLSEVLRLLDSFASTEVVCGVCNHPVSGRGSSLCSAVHLPNVIDTLKEQRDHFENKWNTAEANLDEYREILGETKAELDELKMQPTEKPPKKVDCSKCQHGLWSRGACVIGNDTKCFSCRDFVLAESEVDEVAVKLKHEREVNAAHMTAIRILSCELEDTKKKLEDLKAKQSKTEDIDSAVRRIDVIVNGQSVTLRVDPDVSLWVLSRMAMDLGGVSRLYRARSWELRDRDGTLMDLSLRVKHLGPGDDLFYLSPAVGYGG